MYTYLNNKPNIIYMALLSQAQDMDVQLMRYSLRRAGFRLRSPHYKYKESNLDQVWREGDNIKFNIKHLMFK